MRACGGGDNSALTQRAGPHKGALPGDPRPPRQPRLRGARPDPRLGAAGGARGAPGTQEGERGDWRREGGEPREAAIPRSGGHWSGPVARGWAGEGAPERGRPRGKEARMPMEGEASGRGAAPS